MRSVGLAGAWAGSLVGGGFIGVAGSLAGDGFVGRRGNVKGGGGGGGDDGALTGSASGKRCARINIGFECGSAKLCSRFGHGAAQSSAKIKRWCQGDAVSSSRSQRDTVTG